MSERICYTVIATIPDAATLREYIHWLEDGHLDEVVAASAHSAMIVLLDDAETGKPLSERTKGGTVLTQYIFSTRETFEQYEREHAPALRADGLKRFGPDTGKGVMFARSVGVIL